MSNLEQENTNEESVRFFCFIPGAGGQQGAPSRMTILIPGEGKQAMNPDGTKRPDTTGRSYRANAQGIMTVPASDEKAIAIIRKQAKSPLSGITEDPDVYNNVILPPERKLEREKRRVAGLEEENKRLVAQLSAVKGGKEK